MRDKYGVGDDPYCYPGSNTLINLLNITDQLLLDEAEIDFTTERYRIYKSSISTISDLTFTHLTFLHHYLFQDLYDWAGHVRTVDISKGGTRFCTFSRIEPEAAKIFSRVTNLSNVRVKEILIKEAASIFCEMNILHPFRDGNGRVQRFFFEELFFTLGFNITWPDISTEEWLSSNIAAVNLNLEPLEKIFTSALAKH